MLTVSFSFQVRKAFVISGVQFYKVLLAAGAITAAIFVIQPNTFADILRELHNRIGAYPLEVAVVSSLLVGHLDPIVTDAITVK
jgi:hypothetical protein